MRQGQGWGNRFSPGMVRSLLAHSSEGGHSDFAPTDERQIHLLESLLRRFDHVGFERVCSGIGVPNIYEYLRDEEQIPELPDVAEAIASAKDRTKAIVTAGTDPHNPSALCRATIDILVSILASEAGNLFLKVFATGGVYLAGGVALHVLDALQEPRFFETFTKKGRFRNLMERVPVHVITARAALIGAAAYGLESVNRPVGAITRMSQTFPIVYLARHGETAWTITGQHTGRTDLPLTERGADMARRLGERLNGSTFAKVFTSPLLRAVQTCNLAGFGARG